MPETVDWLAPFSRWQSWSIIAGNLLPLLGIFYLGWDASTLVILYWMETAIVGFWLIVRLLLARSSSLPPVSTGARVVRQFAGPVLGLFLILHAGIFMAVHLFFLHAMAPGEWSRHLGSPVAFVRDFVIPSGVWIPLAGLFIARGVVTIGEIRARSPVLHLIAGFYGRIILMQFVILLGGIISVALGSPVLLLVLIVLFKTTVELYWDTFGTAIQAAAAKASRTPPD